MKLLSNIWVLTAIAFVLFAGTLTGFWLSASKVKPQLPETMHTKEVDGAAVAALWNTQTGHVEEMVEELKRRTQALDQQKAELEQMRERIDAEKLELTRIQKDISEQQATLDDMVTRIEAAEVKNLRSQATVYSNMDPEATIQVFKTMDDVSVAKLLYFMNSDSQSAIFAALIEDPESQRVSPTSGKLTGAEKVARLNELLKYIQPPERPKSTGGF